MATLTSNEEEVIRTDEDGVALQDRDHFRETNPRNPVHFDSMGGRSNIILVPKSVFYTL